MYSFQLFIDVIIGRSASPTQHFLFLFDHDDDINVNYVQLLYNRERDTLVEGNRISFLSLSTSLHRYRLSLVSTVVSSSRYVNKTFSLKYSTFISAVQVVVPFFSFFQNKNKQTAKENPKTQHKLLRHSCINCK